METTSDKLKYIIKEIEATPLHFKEIKLAIEKRVKYYKANEIFLDNISEEKILKHSFQSEVIQLGEKLEKASILLDKIKGIETHSHAPELNKLHTINGAIIPTPRKETIKEAVEYIATIKPLSDIKQF